MSNDESLIDVIDLKKWYSVRTGFISMLRGRNLILKAVDGVSFTIKKNEIYGLAGESGSGKTTAGKLVLRLIEPTDGQVQLKGKNILTLGKAEMKEFRKRAQIIFQDPYGYLYPIFTINDFVAEPLIVHKIGNAKKLVPEAIERVELHPAEEFLNRYPHELSGGQRQRVAIARALILNPEFIVADEPVSMLDVSIRSSILDLMVKLKDELNISYLYITHDLATAKNVCNRVGIMYLGKIVEEAGAEELLDAPLHPYTEALIAAVPVPDPTAEKSKVIIKGEIPNPTDVPQGCRFNTRCPYVMNICREKEPELIEVKKWHRVACHLRN